jgi:acyl carrier protein
MTGMVLARGLLAEATGADVAAVPDDARIGNFERWDSLAHMRLILAVEHRIGRQLEPDEIVRIEALTDVALLLNGHLSGA